MGVPANNKQGERRMITINREDQKVEVILEVLDAYGKHVERDVARIEKWGDICKWDDNDLDLAKTHIETFKILKQTIKSILTSD